MLIISLIAGLVGGCLLAYVFGSFLSFVIGFLVCFFGAAGLMAQVMGDVNRATQDKRDAAILNELRKMNNKDE